MKNTKNTKNTDSLWLTSKRVGLVLALLFIVGLSGFTIYSRSLAERQKPLVSVTFPESATATWSYETTSTIEPATEEFAALGAEWTVTVTVPYEAFSYFIDILPGVRGTATTDFLQFPELLQAMLWRYQHENGDWTVVIAIT